MCKRRELQQYLPFTVLKRYNDLERVKHVFSGVATVLTVYGIETFKNDVVESVSTLDCCNSTYRLRY